MCSPKGREEISSRPTYDSYRRPVTQTWEDGATVSYVYGTDGALGRMTDSATGRTTKYYYDFQGLLKRTQETGTDYSNKVTWTYSSTNNLTQQKQVLDGSTYTTNYTYDTHNRLSAVTRGIVSSVYAYDTLSRLSKLTITRNDADMVTADLTYKAGGNSCTTSGQIATWKNSRYNTMSDGSLVGDTTFSYTYDDKGNITAISDGTNTTAYVYDAKGQLTRENNQAAGKTWVYAYDNGGNITSKTEYAYTTATNPSSPTSTKTYTYGDTSWKDLLTGYNGATLTYDTIGNLTSDGTWSYTWQHGRQLAGMSNGTKSLTFAYNADGKRVAKTYVNGEDTTEVQYYYAGNQLAKMTRGDKSLAFTYDSLGPRSVVYNGSNYYYLRNAQGDILGIVSAYGAVVASYTYDAWGNVLSVTGSMSGTLGTLNPLRYRGYVYDTETGLYYLNTRYYNPSWGRFINADVFASTGQGVLGSNMFAYCNNNPVMGYDPSGCRPIWEHDFGGGIIGYTDTGTGNHSSQELAIRKEFEDRGGTIAPAGATVTSWSISKDRHYRTTGEVYMESAKQAVTYFPCTILRGIATYAISDFVVKEIKLARIGKYAEKGVGTISNIVGDFLGLSSFPAADIPKGVYDRYIVSVTYDLPDPLNGMMISYTGVHVYLYVEHQTCLYTSQSSEFSFVQMGG